MNRKRRLVLIVAGSLAVVIAVCLAVIFTAGGSNGNSNGGAQLQSVAQPPSAKEVADNLGCGKFKDLGPGHPSGLGVYLYITDSGSCWIGTHKYGIDTFADKGVRDQWLAAAEPFGVVPKWETDTSVVYPSVN